MLVLAYADGFGVNLHQLSQGVLQAAGNAGCAAQAHVDIRHFLASVFTGAIHRRAGFADHHFVDDLARVMLRHEFDEFTGQFVSLAAGCAVTNGNQVHAMFFGQFGQGVERAIPIFAGLVWVHSGCFHQLARGVDHGHFHTGANAWV